MIVWKLSKIKTNAIVNQEKKKMRAFLCLIAPFWLSFYFNLSLKKKEIGTDEGRKKMKKKNLKKYEEIFKEQNKG